MLRRSLQQEPSVETVFGHPRSHFLLTTASFLQWAQRFHLQLPDLIELSLRGHHLAKGARKERALLQFP